MRFTRFLVVSATAVALGLPAVAVAAPATAAVSTTTVTSDSAAAAKKHHKINSRIVNVTKQDLEIRSKVRNYFNAFTFLQKKACKTCKWHKISRKRTDRDGRVNYPVGAPKQGRWYFRVGTPPRGEYGVSFGQTFYTYQY